jgi:acetyltransferase-like isoleucine patch superfamily enzyme
MKVLKALTLLLPWPLRRVILNSMFGYKIHRDSYIGFAWIFPKQLVMDAKSKIGHLTMCREIDLLQLGAHASIGRLNWITGFPSGSSSKHFAHQTERSSSLILGDHASITHRHMVDCTNTVSIGAFSTFAGFRSQILTHSIDLANCRQSSAPISVGKYCFVGTDCVLLGGSTLPENSVLGAKSLLNKQYSDTFWLYAGTPAKPVKPLGADLAYFSRTDGFVE